MFPSKVEFFEVMTIIMWANTARTNEIFFLSRQLVLLSEGYSLLLYSMSIIITATQFMSNCLMILNTVKHENVIQKETKKEKSSTE